jgi:hypothetical protein
LNLRIALCFIDIDLTLKKVRVELRFD